MRLNDALGVLSKADNLDYEFYHMHTSQRFFFHFLQNYNESFSSSSIAN